MIWVIQRSVPVPPSARRTTLISRDEPLDYQPIHRKSCLANAKTALTHDPYRIAVESPYRDLGREPRHVLCKVRARRCRQDHVA